MKTVKLYNGVNMPCVGFGTDWTFIFIRKNVRHLEWKILRFSGDSGAWRFQLKSQN